MSIKWDCVKSTLLIVCVRKCENMEELEGMVTCNIIHCIFFFLRFNWLQALEKLAICNQKNLAIKTRSMVSHLLIIIWVNWNYYGGDHQWWRGLLWKKPQLFIRRRKPSLNRHYCTYSFTWHYFTWYVAECLSVRQLILRQITHSVVLYVCMYVCVTLRNVIYVWRAGYATCAWTAEALGRPFVIRV